MSSVKRSQTLKTGVQPETVKRQQMKDRSERALPKEKCPNLLPIKATTQKKTQFFSKC